MRKLARIKNNVLQFHHPILQDEHGDARTIRRGVAKFKAKIQGQIQDDVQTLMDADDPFAVDRSKLHERAVEAFFSPMEDAPLWRPGWTAADEQHEQFLARVANDPTLEQREEFAKLESALRARIVSLEATVLALQQRLADKIDAEKKTTVLQAFDHFEKTYRTENGVNEGRRPKVLKNVKRILDAVGMTRRYSDLTCIDLEKAIDSLKKNKSDKPLGDTTNAMMRIEIRKFCSWLARDAKAGDGLGFSNPAENMHVPDLAKLHRKKVAKQGGIKNIDPAILLENPTLSAWQRALIGICGYCGLSLSEAAGLQWDDIDLENRVIQVKDNEAKTDLKTTNRFRYAPFFSALIPIITEHKKSARDGYPFVFYKNYSETWLYQENGVGYYKCNGLSTKIIKATGVPAVAKKLRAWCGTRIHCESGSEAESKALGHTERVAKLSYIEAKSAAIAAAKRME